MKTGRSHQAKRRPADSPLPANLPTRRSWIDGQLASIPDQWIVACLDDLVDASSPICYGILMPGIDIPGGVPVIKVRDIEDGTIVGQNLLRTLPSIEAKYVRSRLKGGDILLAIRGSVGAVAVVPPALEGANITQDSARIRLRDRELADYLVHTLRSRLVQHQIAHAVVGQAVKGINISSVRRLKVVVPPPQIRGRICHVVDSWDTCLRAINNLIETKRRFKKGMAQQLLTGKLRFPEFRNKKWAEYHLGEIFEERNEIGRGDLHLLSITATNGVVPRDDLDKKDTSNQDKSKYKRIAPGDIGYNTMRMWQGVSALSTLEGIVSPAYTVCTPGKRIDGRFAKHLFKFPAMVRTFWRFSQGLVDDTLNLKFHNFALIKAMFPPLEEQRLIADTLDCLDREIDLLIRQAEALRRQKQGLMQQLLTGKISVKA